MVYDVIVVGCGGVGSAALWQLASRGARVLGIDPFAPGHDRGSSHGDTRVIRQAYFEHPDYVPLLRAAYALWSDLEQQDGMQLYHEAGVLQIGPPDGEVVPGVLASARLHGLEVETLSAADVAARFPGFVVPEGYRAVFEQRAGYLRVEQCVLACARRAVARGAELRLGETVVGWQLQGDTLRVETDAGRYQARRLVVTAGSWAAGLLQELGLQLTVLRKHLHWYGGAAPAFREDSGCPVFLYELPEGVYYGFPEIDAQGVKVAEHSGGEPIAEPSLLDRAEDAAESQRNEAFVRRWLPAVQGGRTRHAVCMYTMSPDGHFLVDRYPRQPAVCFAAGLSGHGFKFATVLGAILADLALGGESPLPWQFLRCDPATRP